MLQHEISANPRSALVDVIRQVRQRWRRKLALRGAVGFLAATAVALIGSAYALEALKFSPASILGFRVALLLAALAFAGWFLVRPLLRRVSDEQVALYLEEHEPTLEATIITAMEAERAGTASDMSPALVRKLVEAAIERVQQIEEGRRIERVPVRRYATAAGIVAVVAIAIFALGPAYLRHALSALLVISRDVEAAAPYRIDVTPGDATVPKGADQTISATLSGFDAGDATVFLRKGAATEFERVPMMRGENGAYDGMLFDLAEGMEYYVEAAGVRSRSFHLKVVELPYVKQLDLEYRFPSYTGLEPRIVEDGGDVAALKGTDVRLTIQPTMAATSGRVVINDGTASTSAPLTANPDGTLGGNFIASSNGSYRIELDGPAGEKVAASPEYTIDVLADQAPSVTLSKPGRDTDATPVQEFAVEARADDDFAVKNLQLVYSVNGGPEKTIGLYNGSKPTPEVTAGHTFYLEELGVQPGDAVSYYARAADNDASGGPKQATSDIYFLRIRPFGKDFKPATSMGGGGGGGGAGGEVGALSQQQRQIIAGTFKIQRDRRTMTADKIKEALVVLALSQSKLREQVQGLVDRMNSRLVAPDPAFKKIAELLPQAAAEMKTAEGHLQGQKADQALPPEQKALQFLQQAEEEYELQVQTNRNAGGGGGGGAGSIAEDLADLFKLELDKMANQYETNQQAMQQNADQQVDELAEKLRELSRRQEQEVQRRAQAGNQAANGRSGDLQRALAEQAEQAARQLERMSREQNRPDLANAARQMQQAADAMKRAAASGDPSAAGQAAAAAERLRDVQRQLQGTQGARAERDVKDAQRQAEQIQREQRDIANELKNMPASGGERASRAQQLGQRKDALQQQVASLENQLDRNARELARESRDASRKLQEAAGQIRDDKIKEKLQYSRQVLGSQQPSLQDFARTLEDQLDANIDSLRRKLDEAASALGPNGRDRNADAVDRARELTRGVESLGRRMQERADARGQQGRDGQQQGQQGQDQQGQQGQRGQQGQEGQQGQSGQEGQAGQKGQAGQQGQGQQGQSGQQGQGGGQGDRAEGRGQADGREGGGNTDGAYRDGPGGWGSRRPGDWFSPDEIRQFRDEARRWTGQGRELRDLLRQQNIDPRELDEILRRLRELEDGRVYRDADELLRLQTQVAEGLKRFEYDLRRKIGNDADRALVTGSDEVPPEFRKLVEEYYRSLSRGRQQEK